MVAKSVRKLSSYSTINRRKDPRMVHRDRLESKNLVVFDEKIDVSFVDENPFRTCLTECLCLLIVLGESFLH